MACSLARTTVGTHESVSAHRTPHAVSVLPLPSFGLEVCAASSSHPTKDLSATGLVVESDGLSVPLVCRGMSVIENAMSLSAVVWTAVVADVLHNHMGCPRLGERSVARIGHVHTF